MISIIQIIFVIILLGTLMIAIEPIREYFDIIDDPAMVIFPLMAYIPHTISIVVLLEIIKQLNKRSLAGETSVEDFYSKFQVEPTTSSLVMAIRKASMGLAILITGISWFFGIFTMSGGDSLLLSPLNMLTLSSTLSFLIVWFVYSIRIKDNPASLYLILLAVVNISINTFAIILAEDNLVLPLTLSYQVLALVLIVSRWLYVQFRE